MTTRLLPLVSSLIDLVLFTWSETSSSWRLCRMQSPFVSFVSSSFKVYKFQTSIYRLAGAQELFVHVNRARPLLFSSSSTHVSPYQRDDDVMDLLSITSSLSSVLLSGSRGGIISFSFWYLGHRYNSELGREGKENTSLRILVCAKDTEKKKSRFISNVFLSVRLIIYVIIGLIRNSYRGRR